MTASDDGRQAHWEDVYSSKGVDEMSWFQRDPEVSLRLVAGAPGSVVDVGAGASVLVDRLLAAGRTDVTLLDLSPAALAVTRERLGQAGDAVTFVAADVVGWEPGRTFDCWHDRAVFHFLTDPARQAAYVATAGAAGRARTVRWCWAPSPPTGPTQCSGLPTARHEPADLATLFADDFDLEHAEHETHRTPWGAEQHFTWVVLRRH